MLFEMFFIVTSYQCLSKKKPKTTKNPNKPKNPK